MKAITLIAILVFWMNSHVLSQQPPQRDIDLESFMERLFPVQDEDLDYESIYEVLLQLFLNPIDINRASA
ncbi:hypothetical protein, partial [Algoriphagus aquimarinus]|uniref:hypothetical protein n=1 Tax=Algoriphagus aquimarinus TaxID=237018 RepID=UPI0030DA68DC